MKRLMNFKSSIIVTKNQFESGTEFGEARVSATNYYHKDFVFFQTI